MVGSALKKLASENNMNINKGVAYGIFHGFAATFCEGSGYKLIQLTTTFPDMEKLNELRRSLEKINLLKVYRVQELLFGADYVFIRFFDNPGTMKKLNAFVEWFFPQLEETGATKWNICTECKGEIENGSWKLINGMAFYLHDQCAESVKRHIEQQEQVTKEERTGSYFGGYIGAHLGALVGAIIWAIVWNFGYIASVIGFVIGWVAEKGYNLLHGKQGKGKVVILILAVIFGVLLGTFAGQTLMLYTMVNNGELYEFALSDVPWLSVALLFDGEYLASIAGSVLIGLIFAGLGVFSILKRAKQEVSGTKFVDLP